MACALHRSELIVSLDLNLSISTEYLHHQNINNLLIYQVHEICQELADRTKSND